MIDTEDHDLIIIISPISVPSLPLRVFVNPNLKHQTSNIKPQTYLRNSTLHMNIIITGANGNLGIAVTNHFLSKGFNVIATVHNEEARKEFTPNKNLFVEVADLTDEDAATAFVQNSIASHKKIDAALLLVGGFAMGSMNETKSSDIKKQFSLNFDTAYHVARPVYEHMMEQNAGRIVFVGARPALLAGAGKNMIAYGLSKSLLFKLAEYINADAKGKNVTATVIVPSTIDTPANRKSMPDADPSNWVKPEAIAQVLDFIVSDTSSVLRETVLKVYNNA
jgi:NAD(P)-dependent dehydrogenase (short-subunit alcohol dehydrogenase family)